MSDKPLSAKQRTEKRIVEQFLELYNELRSTSFAIIELSDSPDLICQDSATGEPLYLEVTLFEDLPGDIPYLLEKSDKPVSPTTETTMVSFDKDSVEQLRSSLTKKLRSVYGPDTALVLKQVSPLWEPSDWERVADSFRSSVLQGKERYYGAGVWIICTDASTWPASNALFCLSRPVEK